MNKTLAAVLLTAFLLFPLGLMIGFCAGVYTTELGQQIITGAFAEEELADTSVCQEIETDRFSLSYPANWILAEEEENFDINGYFSIDSPGFSYVLFEIWNVDASAQDLTAETLEYYEQIVKTESFSDFDSWGGFTGVGTTITGKTLGSPVRVNIFSHSSDSYSFTVVEYWDSETESLVEPGFRKIRETFRFRESADVENRSDTEPDSQPNENETAEL
ncbi:MAG: hypothetical protein AAF802_07955 [Planctomycetota bacterium]